jgi:signal transduction histidine kinase/ActR/RegA family two-component response regulator
MAVEPGTPTVERARVLFVEHSEPDFRLMVNALQSAVRQSEFRRVEDADSMRSALAETSWDAVISEWALPRFNAFVALDVLKEMKLAIPFIVLSEKIDEATVDAMRAGASDLVLKGNFARLSSALDRALREGKIHQSRRASDRAQADRTANLASVNADLERSHDSLREALEARDAFLSIASHELRTPLTSLKLQVQSLIRYRKNTSSIAEELKRIDRQADRLTDLVEHLLDVSRITGNRLQLELEDMDLSDLVRQVAARFELDLQSCGSTLRMDAARPMRGLWDRERLDQVITNLVSNAIKFGGGKPIEVSIEPSDEGARLSVRDYGIGIEASDQARIFERFERAVSSRHFGGLGLGLWIVRQIVEAIGGTLSVQSEIGSGSIFRVELPSVPRATAPAESAPSKRVILVVDDDAEFREALRLMLADRGYGVALSGGGDEAFAYLRSHPVPSLILLDLLMSEMDGYEFRSRQLADPGLSEIPVVVATGAKDANLRMSELRGAAVIKKPVEIQTLVAAIEAHRSPDSRRSTAQATGASAR